MLKFYILATSNLFIGKSHIANSNSKFLFFWTPLFSSLEKKKTGGIGFNFFRTKIRLSLSPARLSLGLTELDKSYGIYFNTTLISQNMNKVLLSVTGYINPAPMSSLSWLTNLVLRTLETVKRPCKLAGLFWLCKLSDKGVNSLIREKCPDCLSSC